MAHYRAGYFSLMEQANLFNDESFTLYFKDIIFPQVQDTMFLDGFVWDSPDASLLHGNFEQALIENRISVMATYADRDSEVIPFGTEGFNSYTDSIPTMKTRKIVNEFDFRKKLELVTMWNGRGQGAMIPELMRDELEPDFMLMIEHFGNSLTYQRDQMVSNTAGLVITKTDNNPQGLNFTFQSRVPAANITTLTTTARWFTDSGKTTVGTASNPPKDCRTMVRKMRKAGIGAITLEVNATSFYEDMDHPKWQEVIGGYVNPAVKLAGADADGSAGMAAKLAENSNESTMVAAVASYLGVAIQLSDRMVGIEKYDKSAKKLVRTSIDSFEANVWVFRPSGRIGAIKSILPIVPDTDGVVADIFQGRGTIIYDYDKANKTQDWKGELASLCVPERPTEMYYIKPSVV